MLATARQFALSPRIFDAQRQIASIATRLLILEHRLYEIQHSLPLVASHLAMEEESIPNSAAGYLYGKLAQIQNQCLRRAARELLVLSKKTDQDLVLEFCGLSTADAESEDLGPETGDPLDPLRIMVLKRWPDLPESLGRPSAWPSDDEEDDDD